MVDKVPDQFLLNTASWRFLIPQLYRKFPDDDILLNISAISPPSVRLTVGRIGAIFDLDVVVNVLDFGEIIPVACISVVSSILCSFSDWFYSQPFKPQKVTCLK
jgi:lipopolysaccharide-binding protein